jgi:DNA-binding transcriptional LysR family regulator
MSSRARIGWTLTPEGHALYERACLLENEMQSLQRTALGQATLAGRVRVTAPPLLLSA